MTTAKRRAYAGYTHEPYECCGKVPESGGRPKRTICVDCANLIEEGKAARAALQDQKLDVFQWTERDYGWPRWYGVEADLDSDEHRALATAFWTLVNRVSQPAPGDTPHDTGIPDPERRHRWGDGSWETPMKPWPRVLSVEGPSHDSWSFGTKVLLPKAVQEALDALHQAIGAVLNSTYRRGKERGLSVLHGLASGESTIQAFNDAHLTREQRQAAERARRERSE